MGRYAWEHGYVSAFEVMDILRREDCRISKTGMIQPMFLWGAPGVGKTTMVRDYTAMHEIGLKEHMTAQDREGADVAGQPLTRMVPVRELYEQRGEAVPAGVDPDEQIPQTEYALPLWLPIEERDGPKGVLFLDEFNRQDADVINAYMELVGTGTITQSGYRLPRGWMIVAAANLVVEGFATKPLDPAMVDRFLHYAPGTQMAHWARWALDNDIQPEVIDFVLGNQNELIALSDAEFSPEMTIEATLRSAARFSAIYKPEMEDRIVDVLGTGLLGVDATERFILERRRGIGALTGKQVLTNTASINGESMTALEAQKWMAENKLPQLIRASNERAITELMKYEAPLGKPPAGEKELKSYKGRLVMANNLYQWLRSTPDNGICGEALASLREAAPEWMAAIAIIDRRNSNEIRDMLGNTSASVRRKSRREMLAERRANVRREDYHDPGVFDDTERIIEEFNHRKQREEDAA